jgi:hypothetical protein
MGPKWTIHYSRGKELELIIQDRDLVIILNSRRRSKSFWDEFTPETKEKISEALTGRPNTLLEKISIKQIIYPSIAEFKTGIARKTIRKKLMI